MAHSLPSGYRRGARTRRRPGAFALLPKRSQKNLRGNLAFTPFCSMGEGRSATTQIGRQLTVMTPPLALFHSWPLWDQAHHFDLGCTLDGVAADVAAPLGQRIPAFGLPGFGSATSRTIPSPGPERFTTFSDCRAELRSPGARPPRFIASNREWRWSGCGHTRSSIGEGSRSTSTCVRPPARPGACG